MQHHQHKHYHHLHAFDDVHYDAATHDDYPRHHHVWTGNHNFNTVLDDDGHADDYNVTVGVDHEHCGYDFHFS